MSLCLLMTHLQGYVLIEKEFKCQSQSHLGVEVSYFVVATVATDLEFTDCWVGFYILELKFRKLLVNDTEPAWHGTGFSRAFSSTNKSRLLRTTGIYRKKL